MALPTLPTTSFILVCQRLHCRGERYKHKMGKTNNFYYKKKTKKGGNNKVEMNSWFVCELQCKFSNVSLAFGIKDVVVTHCMKGHLEQEYGVLF
jgi:hypothetical protein